MPSPYDGLFAPQEWADPSSLGQNDPADLRDPWAHRRGEPRAFAFLWTMYLFASVAGSVLWVAQSGGLAIGAYGPAARIMLVVVAVGCTLLWPMTRLSQQSPPRHAILAILADLVVVLMPVQVVVWPMAWLANWPWPTISAIGAIIAAWTILIGGVLALALTPHSDRDNTTSNEFRRARALSLARTLWMFAILLLLLGGLVPNLWHLNAAHPWLAMTSPYSAILGVTGVGVLGPTRAILSSEWIVIALVGALGWMVWAVAIVRGVLFLKPQDA